MFKKSKYHLYITNAIIDKLFLTLPTSSPIQIYLRPELNP